MKTYPLNRNNFFKLSTCLLLAFALGACKKKKDDDVGASNCIVRGNYALGCGTLNIAGSLTTVANGFSGAYGVTTDKTYLYVNDTSNVVIKKVAIADGSTSTLVSSGVANLNAITFNGTDLFTESNVSLIKKVVISTGTVTTLTASAASPYDLTADETNVYAVNGSDLKQVDASTGTVTTLATSSSLTLDSLTYDGTYFYAGNNPGMFGSPSIKKITKATGEIADLGVTGLTGITGMTTDGTYLYVLDNAVLKKISIANGSSTTILPSGLSNPQGITTDGTYLYVIDGSTLYKIQ